MATIATLDVLISSDTSGLTRGLREAQRASRTTGRAIQRQMGEVSARFSSATSSVLNFQTAIGVLAGSAGIGLLIRTQMQAVQQMQRLQQITGFQSRTIEALSLQAARYGVEQARANDALVDFSERLGEARTGAGAAVEGFKLLERVAGVQIDLGQNVNAVWADFVAGMGRVNDASTRAAIAAMVGGDALRDLLPVIGQGEQAFRDAAQQVEALGLSFSQLEAAKVQQASAAIADMSAAFQGMNRQLTFELSPAITTVANHFSESFVTAGQNSQNAMSAFVDDAVGSVGVFLEATGSAVNFLATNPMTGQFGLLGLAVFGRKGAAVGSVIGLAFEKIEDSMRRIGIGADDTAAKLAGVSEQLAEAQERVRKMEAQGFAGSIDPAVREIYRDQIALVEELTGRQAELKAQMTDVGWQDFEKYFDANTQAAYGFGDSLAQLGQKLQNLPSASVTVPSIAGIAGPPAVPGQDGASPVEQMREQAQQRLDVLRQSLMSERQLEQQSFFAKQAQLAEWREAGLVGQMEHLALLEGLQRQHQQNLTMIEANGFNARQRLQAQAQQAMMNGWASAAEFSLDQMVGMTSGVAQQSRLMFEVNKAAALALAAVKLPETIMSAYAWGTSIGGPPFGAAMAGVAGAAQVAQMNAIRAASFAGGGGAAAPSIAGTTPAPPVTPVSAQQEQEERPAGTELTVRRRSRRRKWDNEEVEDLIEQINEKLQDGWVLQGIRLA